MANFIAFSGAPTYTFVKNSIPAVAEALGHDNTGDANGLFAERNKGAYVMDAEAANIDALLSRSQHLARSKRKAGDE